MDNIDLLYLRFYTHFIAIQYYAFLLNLNDISVYSEEHHNIGDSNYLGRVAQLVATNVAQISRCIQNPRKMLAPSSKVQYLIYDSLNSIVQ